MVIKMNNEEIIKKIKAEIEKIKPFLLADGGSIEFVKFEDGILDIHLGGACANCGLIDVTLNDGIEQIICGEIEEVKEVRNV